MKSLFNDAHRNRLKSRVSSLSGVEKPLFGSMPAERAVCHLIDSLRAPFNPETEEKFKESFYSSRLGQWFVISSPFPWPKGKIKIPSDLEPIFFNSEPADGFEADKETLLQEIENFSNSRDKKFYPSPVFGHLSADQWAKLQYRHLDHHLKQFGR